MYFVKFSWCVSWSIIQLRCTFLMWSNLPGASSYFTLHHAWIINWMGYNPKLDKFIHVFEKHASGEMNGNFHVEFYSGNMFVHTFFPVSGGKKEKTCKITFESISVTCCFLIRAWKFIFFECINNFTELTIAIFA